MKISITKITLWSTCLLIFGINMAMAQIQTPLDQALRFIEKKQTDWDMETDDITDLAVSNMYPSSHNGMTHIYLTQRYRGIEVYNAITSVHVATDGSIYNVGHRFIPNLDTKINTTEPTINAVAALRAALQYLDLSTMTDLQAKERKSGREVIFDKGDFANSDVHVKLRFQPMPDKTVRLAWDLAIDQLDQEAYWSLRVDATTGEVLHKNNWMVKCQFVDDPYHRHDAACSAHVAEHPAVPVDKVLKHQSEMIQTALAGSYNVFGEFIDGVNSPFESPNHGNRTMMVDPHNVNASPYGWHDTNGQEGAEFTITRGNNVNAYLDLNDSSTPTGQPDGGAGLVFDFPYNAANEAEDQRDIAVTNLFYMVNTLHDYSYHFGLDEPAGAFQQNNYGNWAAGAGDFVLAEAQDGNAMDDDHLNNANFATPPDGGSGRMQMYLWDQGGGKLLTVNSPASVAGSYETGTATGSGGFGPAVSEEPITGEVVLVDDGSSDPTYGCEPLLNDNLEGKIALVDRGGCFFEQKTLNAEAKGAIAVIICNFENSTMGMGGGVDGQDPEIPTVSITSVDCSTFKAAIEEGLTVTLQVPSSSGPTYLDGDLDNGIIAHEFAHGVSNRLTGGPQAAGCLVICAQENELGECLQHTEQQGEGWSDFFTLITSVKPGDTGEMKRGIGTYTQRQETNGSGIRPLPYSTDFNINNFTYDDVVRFSGSHHSIGAVWCQMLWDMYWALVDVYGFNIDYSDMTAGNNIAVQLVMDGMKLQPCQPGFVDSRDAILQADMENNGGANQCLIWEVFSKRGLGYKADQGDPLWDNDGKSSFETLPTCIKELKITKSATSIIEPGEAIDYTINVFNHKDEAASNVVVTDMIPDGCTYVMGSASNGGTASGGMVSWDLGTMDAGQEMELTYQIMTPDNVGSIEVEAEDFEDSSSVIADWVSLSLDTEFDDNWTYIPNGGSIAHTGDGLYAVDNIPTESDQALLWTKPITVSGDQPVLRFYHSFSTPNGTDGGFLQFSRDGGVSYTDIKDDFFKNAYSGPISYQTFTIPFQQAYSGDSEGYIDSYVDLSEYAGETLFFRWRFGTDDNNPATATAYLGWFLDDVSYMDLFTYNEEACVTSDEDGNICGMAPNRGTIVNPATTAVEDAIDKTLGLSVFPNPAKTYLTISLASEYIEKADLSLIGIDGRMVQQRSIQTNGDIQNETLSVSDLAPGLYVVRITTPRGIVTQKVVIE